MKIKNLFALVLIASTLLAVSCGKPADDDAVVEETSTIKTVKVTQLSKDSISRTLEYSANLIANEKNYIAPASPGRIRTINVEIGDKVYSGQTLITMDATQLSQAVLQMNSLQTDLERLDTLLKTGSISQQQYDQMKTQYDVAKSSTQFLAENTTITAPFTGVITEKYFENGELYGGAPNTQAGKAAIVTLEQINPLKAVISVSETFFPQIIMGMQTNLVCDIYPDNMYTGKVSNIYPTINPATRTFDVEISIENNSLELRPGMFSKLSLDMGEVETIVVPAISVLQQEGTNERYIFINENGKARRISVVIGKRFDDKLEIISNELEIGMELIIAGQASLINGQEIEIIE